LFWRQPVSETNADPPHAFDATNAGGQFGTQEARVGRFVGDASNGRESKVDCGWRKSLLFEVNPERSTTLRLNARRGSEQYQLTNSRIACS
jgi:hypothetical protein